MPIELSGDASELRSADLVVTHLPEGGGTVTGAGRRAYAAAGLAGKPGEDLLVASPDGPAELLVGAVPRDGLGPATVRRALAGVAPSLRGYGTVGILLPAGAGDGRDMVAAATEGVLLGAHRFERFLTNTDGRGLGRVLLSSPPGIDGAVAKTALEFGIVSAEAGIEARDLTNTPANHCTPEHLPSRATSAITGGTSPGSASMS